ncbi:zinc finger-containing ubiquitin peptidase 1-like [Dendronephthya gigantea]|uniref:zinc finger-containing ubiquitin peptidase 1-like n=1 Tax=Dendronephthya gigantea TaxID=151771 RepID=UPI00106D3D80|nr:zinc finger-containing ubiquitin peptidase 1-like [Dendronephthya gigantea]
MAEAVIEIDDSTNVCPVCDDQFPKDTIQQHVETHFNNEDKNDSENTIKARCTSPASACKRQSDQNEKDEMLAKRLQQEEIKEVERQKVKENEEFKKLQQMYGMSSESDYVKQYNQSLDKEVSRNKLSMAEYHSKKEKLFDSLLSGEESGESCTKGVVSQLQQQICARGPLTNHFIRLCCPTDHFSSSYGDKSWGCGYRNLQMLLSALIKLEHYKEAVLKVCQTIPSIPRIQCLIEDAWHDGFDQVGAAQLGHKLTETKKWIGATEITVALRFMNLRTHIVDFHQPTSADGTHPELFAWVKRYFSKGVPQIPIYIQHQGHSRLVVGFEERCMKKKTEHLILFDPSNSPKQMQQLFGSQRQQNAGFNLLRKTTNQIKSKQYQLVYVDGIMNEAEKQGSKVLSSTRIP